MHCLIICGKTSFVLKPLNAMLNHVVSRLSLQKLEYEMKRIDLPDDCNCFEIVYCSHAGFPDTNIQLDKSTKLYLLNF